MTDKREQILSRIFVVLQAVTVPAPVKPFECYVRNRGELPAGKRPAVVLLDGDEVAREAVRQQSGRLTLAPNLVDLAPEIYVVMDQREPHNERIGEDLNAIRVAVLKALTTDAELLTLLGSNGDIRYGGCETDLASGRSMEGQMHLRLVFTYALKPSEF